MNDVAIVEAGDEVNTADDIRGIKEAECTLLMARDKLDTVQPLRFPPRLMFLVNLKPVDPEDVHAHQCFQAGMKNLHSEDSKDPRIQIWVGGVAARESHHIC